MLRKLLYKILYMLIFFFSLLTCVLTITANYLYISGPLNSNTVVLIDLGLSANKISILLKKSGVIENPSLFSTIIKLVSLFRPLKSGEYNFTEKVSPVEVIKKLVLGKSIIHRLVIPEGLTVNEIISKINNQKLLTGTVLKTLPEGCLMPSTYFFSYGDKRETLINKMQTEMSVLLNTLKKKLSITSPIKSCKDILILGSIIEKEAGKDSEKPKIAAVFINRLKKNMKLQACPTVIYALTCGRYRLTRMLNKNDLKVKSPYNTYYKLGLPVGAISCPGKKSLEAVVSPATIDSIYFFIDGKGGHHFSKTLSEHNQHVKNLRKVLKR